MKFDNDRALTKIAGCLLLMATASTAQSSRSGSTELSSIISHAPFTQLGISSWAAGGTGVVDVGNPAAAFSNPAALRCNTLTGYVEFGRRLPTTWIVGIDYDNQYLLPAFVSLGTRTDLLNVSFGYANTYNEHPSFSILETTADDPEGTGRYFEFERSVKTHVFFGSFARRMGDDISLGITLGINYLRYDEFIVSSGSGSGVGMAVNAGGIFQATRSLVIGGSLRYISTINFNVSFPSQSVLVPPDSSGYNLRFVQLAFPYTAKFPVGFEIGGKWDVFTPLTLMASFETQIWTGVTSGVFKNIVDIHLGASYEFTPAFSGSIGFFTHHEPNTFNSAYLDQNFVTAGFRWKTDELVSISASILDSHFFSNNAPVDYSNREYQHFNQTYVAMGVGYAF